MALRKKSHQGPRFIGAWLEWPSHPCSDCSLVGVALVELTEPALTQTGRWLQRTGRGDAMTTKVCLGATLSLAAADRLHFGRCGIPQLEHILEPVEARGHWFAAEPEATHEGVARDAVQQLVLAAVA